MRTGLFCLLAAIASTVPVTAPTASAELVCKIVRESHYINNQLVVTETKVCHETGDVADEGPTSTSNMPPPAGSAACIAGILAVGLDPADYCGVDEAPAPQEVTGGLVAAAFRRVPLPPSTFTIEPPGGKTLVNFDTNFYTRERTLHRVVRLLGREVQLRIEIDSYTWHFGDGESVTTRQPGAPYPKLLITHSYREKGDYRPAMDTTWVADYRVGSGPWRPVPGSVTIEGGPVDLRAIEARPTLVGYGD